MGLGPQLGLVTIVFLVVLLFFSFCFFLFFIFYYFGEDYKRACTGPKWNSLDKMAQVIISRLCSLLGLSVDALAFKP